MSRPRSSALLLLAGLFALFLAVAGTTALAAVPWLPFGPDGGDARRIVADPRDHNHLYLGTANGWIYESHNLGANWVRLARIGKRDDLVLDHIVVDPRNPKHLIVGAWVIERPDGGMFISNDGGVTWISQAEMRGQSVRSLAVSPSDPNVLVAGSLTGVWRSTDGGQRWKQISPRDSVEIHNIESVAIDPKDPNVIYAGTWHLPWKTTDGGDHWDNIKEGIIEDSDVFSIIVDPAQPKIVYASACSGIYKSDNGGLLFEKLGRNGIIPSSARRTRVLLQDPNHLETVFAGTTEGLWRSDDAGKSWTRTTGPEIIVNDVHIDPADSRRVFIATDRGGVMASEDGGDTFRSSNGGFSARQITSLKRDSQHPATIYVGVVNDKEWGGIFESDNGGLSWKQRSEGLQGRDVFSIGQAPDGTVIAGTVHGLYRLDPAANTWGRIEDAPNFAPGAEPIAAAPPVTRPPVPIGRNQFAIRKTSRLAAAPARRTASVKGKIAPAKGRSIPAKSKAANTPAARKARAVAAKKTSSTKARTAHPGTRAASTPRPAIAPRAVVAAKTEVIATPTPPPLKHGFDGRVNAIVSAGGSVLAATTLGLLTSQDNGATWTLAGVPDSQDWRYLASAKTNVVSASLRTIQFSSDSGLIWNPIKVPDVITQISAVAVDPAGEVWVGGREGLFVSSDAGVTWTTPKNLYVNSVSNIYYDDATDRVLVTTAGDSSIVFTVQLPQKQVTYAYSGWSLRFARPVGDHIVAATLFDGIVVQPRMVDTPMPAAPKTTAQATPASASK